MVNDSLLFTFQLRHCCVDSPMPSGYLLFIERRINFHFPDDSFFRNELIKPMLLLSQSFFQGFENPVVTNCDLKTDFNLLINCLLHSGRLKNNWRTQFPAFTGGEGFNSSNSLLLQHSTWSCSSSTLSRTQ